MSGGIHKIVASLHMESWRAEMEEKIDRIDQVLPTTIHPPMKRLKKYDNG